MPDNTPAHEACLRELAGLIERSTGEDGLHAALGAFAKPG